tara:strand:+ start:54 stop:1973 length:1920 start_codon:yes stop_codon:yes gene_type:complete
MSWQGLKTQLGEVKDAYLDPLFDKPDSGEEILQKIKNKELGKEWWQEETRKFNALKNLIPEKRQQQIGAILSQTGEIFDEAWESSETVENWWDIPDVIAAGGAHGVNLFNQGVGLLSEGVAAGLHHGLRIHKPVADLGGGVTGAILSRKLVTGGIDLTNKAIASKTASNIAFSTGKKIGNLTQRFRPVNQRTVNVSSMRGNQLTAESSITISKKYPWLTGKKPKPYAFAYDMSQGGGLLKDAIRDPLLRRANVPTSEVNLGKSVKQTGIGLFDRTEAEGIRELVLQRIVDRMEAPNQFIKNTLQPLYPNQDVTNLSTRELNKLIKEEGLWKEYKNLQRETKALKRSKADWSQTDIEDLHELGVFQELKNKNFSQIEPENIESWLKVQEGRVSASKGLDARHHMYLSSSKEILDPKTVPVQWRNEFLTRAREKYDKFGSGSVMRQDIGGHKAFDTTDDPGRPWHVKGRLNETLKKYTDLPRGKSGNIISPKVARNPKTDAPIFNLSTQEGKLQKILFDMKQKTSHGYWSNLEAGFTIDGRLANYSPKVALSVAEHIYDIERVIGEQGLIVTKQLDFWQKDITKGKFGNPPNMSEALDSLQRRIDKIKIPDIEGMKKMYEQDLDTLLTKGEEALRQQQAAR